MRITHQSIKTRLTFVTIAFTLIITLILVGTGLFNLQQVTRTNLLQSTEFNLHLVSELIQTDIQNLDRMRMDASIHPQTIEYLLADDYAALGTALHALLTEDMARNPSVMHLRRFVVTDSELSRRVQVGILTDIVPVMPHVLYRLGDFSHAPQQWTGIKDDVFAVSGREPVFSMVSPVRHGRVAQPIGYIYIAVSANAILAPLDGYPFPEQGNLYLTIGETSYRITDLAFTETPLNFYNARPGNDTPLNPETEIIAFNSATGGRYLAVSIPLGNTGLVLTQTFSTGVVLQEISLVIRLLLFICIGVFILGILIAVFLRRSINRPVRQIESRIKTIAAGDFTPDPLIEWDNEFGEIGRSINQLARDMESLMESRLESEKKKHELEYKMLQNQISPHFLYNSLNSIKWMASIQNATGIVEMTVSLSRLLMNVAKINKTLVPLSKELGLLEDYFVISRYRFGVSIAMNVNVPDEFLDCPIPIFTLQPIVENAIFHGIEASAGIGTISVGAEQPEDMLEITIEDNGVGMDEDTIRKLFEGDESNNQGLFKKVGISNVHARIQYEFGEKYGIRIKSEPGKYTKVIVSLPAKTKG